MLVLADESTILQKIGVVFRYYPTRYSSSAVWVSMLLVSSSSCRDWSHSPRQSGPGCKLEPGSAYRKGCILSVHATLHAPPLATVECFSVHLLHPPPTTPTSTTMRVTSRQSLSIACRSTGGRRSTVFTNHYFLIFINMSTNGLEMTGEWLRRHLSTQTPGFKSGVDTGNFD